MLYKVFTIGWHACEKEKKWGYKGGRHSYELTLVLTPCLFTRVEMYRITKTTVTIRTVTGFKGAPVATAISIEP